MYLDKTNRHKRLTTTEKLTAAPSASLNAYGTTPLVSQLSKILAGLSAWLTKHSSLTNGRINGKTVAELRNKLPEVNRQSWMADKEVQRLGNQTLALLKRIDRENKLVFIVHGRDLQMREAARKRKLDVVLAGQLSGRLGSYAGANERTGLTERFRWQAISAAISHSQDLTAIDS